MSVSPKPPAVPAVSREARSALVLLLLINLFNYLDRQVLAAVVPQIKQSFFGDNGAGPGGTLATILTWCQQHLGFRPENALVGLLSMAFMSCYMIGAPIFGRLGERRSRWKLIAVGVALWSLASGASGLAGTFTALLLTRCFVGIGEAAYGPVAPALLSDLYPIQVRGRILSYFYLAIPVGSALGYVFGEQIARSGLGPWAAHLFGGGAESWRWAFYLVVPPGLLLGLWSLLRRDPVRGQCDPGAVATPARLGWRDHLVLVRTPSFVLCTLGMCAMTFAIGGIAFWMPSYLESRPGCGHSPTTVFGAITVVAGLAATLLGGIAGDRLRPHFPGSYFLVSSAAMFAGVPLLLGTLVAPFPWAWGLLFATCFCLFFNTGPTNTILANVTHPSLRSPAFALNILVIHALGDVISPTLIGLASDRYGLRNAFIGVAFVFLLAGLCWFLGAKHLARDTALAPTRMGIVE